uniref:Protein Wnt n=1 Tax=Thamnocephalus platyurus TaxID=91582 RepID=A0A0S1NEZ3_9CRUS|nr:WntA ligand [Thamnocephalus platyurus]
MKRRKFFRILRLIIGLILLVSSVDGNWWEISSPLVNPTNLYDICPQIINNHTQKKLSICSQPQGILKAMVMGAREAITECQSQFKTRRWNCSTVPGTGRFPKALRIKSRERAYIQALTSAGLTSAITRACARGEVADCGCDPRARLMPSKGWEWGGCSDDLAAGEKLGKAAIDRKSDDKRDFDVIVDLHNNEAGRKALQKQVQLVCKCHGVSGSCTVKVCWRKLQALNNVAKSLMERYEGATKVKLSKRKKWKPAGESVRKPTKKDLLYVSDSPNYCEADESLELLGTRGRECNRTSVGTDGCLLLCCGRGYRTIVRMEEEKCNCRFEWCCKVKCEKCIVRRDIYICN